ncbi:unnamed protein product [Cyclocybe aegerita]|uniref:Uncharacterized protein n=1 Tax=Cyclocybe aegerita TaxID=1973307 RepID=A0A8S0W6Z4_CYCAE|nr:unnamed protein product [Cyclocybe aegerita]
MEDGARTEGSTANWTGMAMAKKQSTMVEPLLITVLVDHLLLPPPLHWLSSPENASKSQSPPEDVGQPTLLLQLSLAIKLSTPPSQILAPPGAAWTLDCPHQLAALSTSHPHPLNLVSHHSPSFPLALLPSCPLVPRPRPLELSPSRPCRSSLALSPPPLASLPLCILHPPLPLNRDVGARSDE